MKPQARSKSLGRRAWRRAVQAGVVLLLGYLVLFVTRRCLREAPGELSIDIDAPPGVLWESLQQIGRDRGGLDSDASLERAFGLPIQNASTRWRRVEEGDFVRATPPDWLWGAFGDRIGWEVDHVVPGRVLALRYWIFEVEPVSEETSRLHVRTHGDDAPAHFIMERAMLCGIKARAEHASIAQSMTTSPVSGHVIVGK